MPNGSSVACYHLHKDYCIAEEPSCLSRAQFLALLFYRQSGLDSETPKQSKGERVPFDVF